MKTIKRFVLPTLLAFLLIPSALSCGADNRIADFKEAYEKTEISANFMKEMRVEEVATGTGKKARPAKKESLRAPRKKGTESLSKTKRSVNYVLDKTEYFPLAAQLTKGDGSVSELPFLAWPGPAFVCSGVCAEIGDSLVVPTKLVRMIPQGEFGHVLGDEFESQVFVFEKNGVYDLILRDASNGSYLSISKRATEALDVDQETLGRLLSYDPKDDSPISIASFLEDNQTSLNLFMDSAHKFAEEAVEEARSLGKVTRNGKTYTLSWNEDVGEIAWHTDSKPKTGRSLSYDGIDSRLMFRENELLYTEQYTNPVASSNFRNHAWMTKESFATSVHVTRDEEGMKCLEASYSAPDETPGDFVIYYLKAERVSSGTQITMARAIPMAGDGRGDLYVYNALFSEDYCYLAEYGSGYPLAEYDPSRCVFEPGMCEMTQNGHTIFSYDTIYNSLTLGSYAIDGLGKGYYSPTRFKNTIKTLPFSEDFFPPEPDQTVTGYFRYNYEMFLQWNGYQFEYFTNKDGKVFPGHLSHDVFFTALAQEEGPRAVNILTTQLVASGAIRSYGSPFYDAIEDILAPFGLTLSTKLGSKVESFLRSAKCGDMINENMDNPVKPGLILDYAKMIADSQGKQVFPKVAWTL